MSLSRQYATTCDLADFAQPALVELIPEIAPRYEAAKPHRKAWEFAMAALFLRDVGRLDSGAEILDVAAGSEEMIFWLANRCERIVATDIYGQGEFGDREAVGTFLDDPASFAPYDYPRERLEVRNMDARALDYPDASFDVVVSFSSIEHFGYAEDIARSAQEIGRVLRPGGHAFIVTEVFVHRHPVDFAGIAATEALAAALRPWPGLRERVPNIGDILTPSQLHRLIVKPSGLRLMQRLRIAAPDDASANVHTVQVDGSVTSSTGAEYPHTLLAAHWSRFTSVCLPLIKPG